MDESLFGASQTLAPKLCGVGVPKLDLTRFEILFSNLHDGSCFVAVLLFPSSCASADSAQDLRLISELRCALRCCGRRLRDELCQRARDVGLA